jgi:hypothetical protein
VLLGHYLEQGTVKMKLELNGRAVYHWIQTTQLDRDEAQSLEFRRLSIAAASDGSQENRLCLDAHAAGHTLG